jgi:transcriptional regulator with XRE-family HTH domain
VNPAELLRAARERAALTQEQLALAAETSQAAIARYERGHTAPSLKVFTRLLAACGLEAQVELVPLHADVDAEIRACLGRAPCDRLLDTGWDQLFDNLAERTIDYVVCGQVAVGLYSVRSDVIAQHVMERQEATFRGWYGPLHVRVVDRADFDEAYAAAVTVAVGQSGIRVEAVDQALDSVGHSRMVQRFRELTSR